MLRAMLALSLALAVGQTQAQNVIVSPQALAEHIKAENSAEVLVEAEFSELRRGSEESVFLKARIEQMSPNGPSVYWGAPSPRNGRLVPTELEIETPHGFTARSVRYERPQKVSLEPGERDFVLGPGIAQFHFRLRADRDLTLGDYVVKGKLRFQRISKVTVSEPQELEFSVPVHVVEHNAKVSKNSSYPWEMTPARWVGVILLMPIMLPITLFTWDGC